MFYVISASHEVVDTFENFDDAYRCQSVNEGSFIEYHVVIIWG